MSIDPTSTRLTMGTDHPEPAWVIVTRAKPSPDQATPFLGDNANEVTDLRWLPDGSLVAAFGGPPPAQLPDGVRGFDPPETYYSSGPRDVTGPWWLISGVNTQDPGDYGSWTSTWAWDQTDTFIPIANNAIVVWLKY